MHVQNFRFYTFHKRQNIQSFTYVGVSNVLIHMTHIYVFRQMKSEKNTVLFFEFVKNICIQFIQLKLREIHIDFKKIYRFNAVSILKHFPTVKDIVSKFEPLPLNDFSSLKFDNREIKFGVAQKEDWNLKYYFVYPETRRVVAVPYWNVNPDGINVAYCYSRSIDGRGNGKYSLKDKRMYITSYRFPILLYRILLLESLLEGNTPFFEQGLYIFPNINLNIANQINRILNNSIQYE